MCAIVLFIVEGQIDALEHDTHNTEWNVPAALTRESTVPAPVQCHSPVPAQQRPDWLGITSFIGGPALAQH